MSDTGLTVRPMMDLSRRYDVTITVDGTAATFRMLDGRRSPLQRDLLGSRATRSRALSGGLAADGPGRPTRGMGGASFDALVSRCGHPVVVKINGRRAVGGLAPGAPPLLNTHEDHKL
jgi:hypothetical protein